jgi:hypothetical protein
MRWLCPALYTLALLLPACAPDRPLAPAGPPARAQEVRVCVAVGDELRDFTGWIDPRTGDTLVAERPLRQVLPDARYAQGQGWFEKNEVITLRQRQFVKYGLPRSLSAADLREPGLRTVGQIHGVHAFVVKLETGPPEILYVPVDPGCLFQAYYMGVTTGEDIRG